MGKKVILGSFILVITSYILFQIGYVATSGPFFCAKCHEVADYVSSWQVSAHKAVLCLSCHQPRGELGKFHAKSRGLNYVFQHFSRDFTIPTRAIVSDQNCIQCHLGDDKSFPEILRLKNTSTINHYETIKQSKSCLECHRATAHSIDIYLSSELKGAKP